MHSLYENCSLCPRNCRVNRLQGERGYCGESSLIRTAWAGLHLGEEPPLTGMNGSGTVFFSGCTLKCGHCQNCQLSSQGMGRALPSAELTDLLLRLQERGAANINLVTASHFTPSIVEYVAAARSQGLTVPVVWNSSGYERLSTLELLKETVDVYLPDCKTLDPELSRRILGAPDYPQSVRPAVLRMVDDKPLVGDRGPIRQGVIVRHLVLPGLLAQSREVLRWFASCLKDRALLSLMFQYTPVRFDPGQADGQPQRTVNRREHEEVLSWMEELEIDDGYVQDPATSADWLPDFTRPNPFPPGQAQPVWHFESGYLE